MEEEKCRDHKKSPYYVKMSKETSLRRKKA